MKTVFVRIYREVTVPQIVGISLSTINKKPPLQGVFFCCLITLLLFLRTNSSLPLLGTNHTLLYPCYLLIISTITPPKALILNRKEPYITIYSKPPTWLLEPLIVSNPRRIIEELTGRLHNTRASYITTHFLRVIQFLIYFKRIVNRFLSIFTMSYNNYFTTR